MIKDDWYRNRTWSGKIDSNFEKNLKYSRGDSNKADFLRIQGSYLLDSNQNNIQEVGIALLTRLFEDFSAEHSTVMLGQEKLGDFYLQKSQFAMAERHFKIVSNYCIAQKSSSGTSGIVDLKLAESILRSINEHRFQEVYLMLKEFAVEGLKNKEHQLYHAELAAQVCHLTGLKEEASGFAQSAIALSKGTKSIFNQPKVTSNKVPAFKFSAMQMLIIPNI